MPPQPPPPRSAAARVWLWGAPVLVVVLLGGAAAIAFAGVGTPTAAVGKASPAAPPETSTSEAATPTTTAPTSADTQRFTTLDELYAAVTADGTSCENLTENPDPPLAVALAQCDLRGGDDRIYLHLWQDAQQRDDGTQANIARLSSRDSDYCFVVGTGDDEAWSVNASSDPSVCRALASRLGGRVLEQAAPAPTTTTTPPPPPVSAGQQNALQTASDYLDFTSFSRTGLIAQLEYEGYSTADATWAVDQLGVDWNVQAALKAREYLEFTSFSRQGLIDQLVYEGFTPSEAEYGVAQEYE